MRDLTESRISRRKLFRLGGVAGLGSVGAFVLVACGGDQGGGQGGGQTTETDDSAQEAPPAAEGEAIAAESDVPENSSVNFTDEETGEPGLLINLGGGEFVAYSAVCTHQQCEVQYQSGTDRITCPCHGSAFIPDQGAAVESGPATAPLPEIAVEVRDGEVYRA